MGFFSGEDIFDAEIFTTKLIDEVSDPIRDAVITAVSLNGDISGYMQAAILSGLNYKINMSFFNYARDTFYRDLPEAKTLNSSINEAETRAILEAQHGETVVIDMGFNGIADMDWIGFHRMQVGYEYNFEANQLYVWENNDPDSGLGPTKNNYDLEFFRIVPYFLDPDGFPDPDAGKTCASISSKYFDSDSGFWVTESGPNLCYTYEHAHLYTHVRYHLASAPDITLFWTADLDTGNYPQLITGALPFYDEYYPIIPIRRNGNFLDEGSTAREQTEKLLKKSHITLSDIEDALKYEVDGDGNETPNDDLDKLDDVFYILGIDIYTHEESALEYLFSWLTELEKIDPFSKADHDTILAEGNRGMPLQRNAFEIVEDEFNLVISYYYINIQTVIGDIGNGDKIIKSIYEGGTQRVYPPQPGGDIFSTPNYYLIRENYLTLKKQDYDVNGNRLNTYTEISWKDPVSRTRLSALGETKTIYRIIRQDPENAPADEAGTSGFYIPMNRIALKELTSPLKEAEALQDGMLLVLYVAEMQHLKWYQTGFFATLIKFILIVFTVLTFAISMGSTATLSMILMELFKFVLQAVVIGYIIELLVTELGWVGAVIAVVAILFIRSMDFFGGSGLANLPWADALLKAVKVITDVGLKYVEVLGEALQEEFDDFLKDAEEKDEELEKLSDLLDDGTHTLNPFAIFAGNAMLNPNESPDQFFERTIHTGNPGVAVLDSIPVFVDTLLRLPESDLSNLKFA